MSSREKILASIKANKPSLLQLPTIDKEVFKSEIDIKAQFKKMLEAVGGNLVDLNSKEEFISKLIALYPTANNNFSSIVEASGFNSMDMDQVKDPRELEDLDVLILEGTIGVAENGAVWVSEENIPVRVSPFITKHLVLVLEKSKLVPTLHHAYEQIEAADFDYGIFLSGPSKTADIEQSLVIGAQGALSLTVFLLDS